LLRRPRADSVVEIESPPGKMFPRVSRRTDWFP
jgi:hypothetical protein